MRKFINIRFLFIGTLFLLLLTSCEKWLTVEPKSSIKAEMMFASESGFKDALMGVYILMTKPEVYGKEMTFGFMDAIALQYEQGSNIDAEYYYAFRYNYSKYLERIDKIWVNSYNIIANLNELIEHLDNQQNIVHPSVKAVIKGEALGLRAYIHFDLLRIFGHGDLVNTPENFDKLSIPYLQKYGRDPKKQLTVREALEFIKADLLESYDLLNQYCPFGGNHPKGYILPNEDKFFDTRELRFNYWAAVCTLARVYLWEGDYKNSLKYATSFCKSGGKTSWVSSSSINVPALKDMDLSFSTEHVFRLDIINLFENLKNYMDYTANGNNVNTQLLYLTKTRYEKLYEKSTLGETDYRYRVQFERLNKITASNYPIIKFWEEEGSRFGKIMPLIKRSEMFLTAAECLLASDDEKDVLQAINYLNEVRKARAIAPNFDIKPSASKTTILNEITKEWQKDFLQEGQMFYYYKRTNMKIPNTVTPITFNNKIYVLPLPLSEIGLGGFEDYND